MKYDFKINTQLRGEDCICTVRYWPGTPSKISGPPERCYEGDPAEVEIMSCLVGGEEAEMTEQEADDLIDRLLDLAAARFDEMVGADKADYYGTMEEERY
jgi:hypothetical protein